MKQYLFSYGSLQNPELQKKIFGREFKGSQDVLQGYRLSSITVKEETAIALSGKESHPIVVISKNAADNICGTVFEVSDRELLLADSYEAINYRRVKEKLASGNEAWVYVEDIFY